MDSKNYIEISPYYPHPLRKCDEYVKSLYIDMLCVFAMYDNDDTENQFGFIQHIMSNVGDSLSIHDHIKRAMEFDVHKIAELIRMVNIDNLAGIIFTDALLVSCTNGMPTKRQTEFLAQFGDMLGLSNKSISFLSELVVSILEKSSYKFNQCVKKYNNTEQFVKSAMCYIWTAIDEVNTVIDNKIYIILLKEQRKIHMFSTVYEFKNYETVILDNIIIDKNISFKFVKNVKIRNCHIKDVRNPDTCVALKFGDLDNLIVENCKFTNLESVFYFDDINRKSDVYFNQKLKSYVGKGAHGIIKDCLFSNCKVSAHSCGAVIIFSSTEVTTRFENCEFRQIYNTNNWPNDSSCIVSGCYGLNLSQTYNCKFYDCRPTYIKSTHGLFYEYSEYSHLLHHNDEYINCCRLATY